MLFFAACTDDTGFFTEDILPEEDRIQTFYTDTLALEFESIWVDSTDTYRAARQLFGNYIDPAFGRITAETYTEVLPRTNLDFGDPADLIYDSIVLRLSVESTYGRIATVQELQVFELTESFPESELISSKTKIAYDDAHNLALQSSFNLEAEKGAAEVRIKLDDRLGRRLLFASSDTLGDKDLFQELFHGLFIGTEAVTYLSREPGAIFSLNSASSGTQIELYYKKRETGTQTFASLTEPFLISGSTPRFSRIERTETSDKLLVQELPQPDTSKLYEFMQGGLLIKNFIRFPDLTELGQVAINQAELIIFVDRETLGASNRFNPPTQISPVFADENGLEVDIDGTPVPASAESSYNSTSASYSISLTNYTQQLVNGQRENYGLILKPINPTFRINRVVFGGTDHPELKPVLRLTYTTLPQ